MRILLAQNASFFPSYGGGIKSDRLMISALSRRGHSCRVISRITNSQQSRKDYLRTLAERSITEIRVETKALIFTLDSVEVHVVAPTNIRSYTVSQVLTFEPDIIIVSTDPLNVLISDLIRLRPTKIVYLARTPMLLPFGPESAFPSKMKTEAVRQAKSVVAVSRFLAEYILEHSGIKAVHLPIQMMEPDDMGCLGSFDNRFITMINPCALKGISIFIMLAESFTDFEFAAIPTWGTTSKDRTELEALPNMVVLDPVDDIRDVFLQSRVIIAPSLLAEGRSRIVVESMLSGVPVLTSDTGGNREAAMGVPCLLPINPIVKYQNRLDDHMMRVPEIPPQDVEPWREALACLITDRSHYAEISKMSRESARTYVANIDESSFEALLHHIARGTGIKS